MSASTHGGDIVRLAGLDDQRVSNSIMEGVSGANEVSKALRKKREDERKGASENR
jgi:hypothetical protein